MFSFLDEPEAFKCGFTFESSDEDNIVADGQSNDIKSNDSESYCEEIFNKIKDYRYGFISIVDGEPQDVTSETDFNNYRTSLAKEFEKNKIGICWDYCEYIADALDKRGIKYHLYFLNLIIGEGKFTTHTFIVADVGDGKCTYIECAYKKYLMCETHIDMKDISEISDVIAQRMLGDVKNHTKQEYDLYEYTDCRPDAGLTCNEYMEYIWEHGKKIYTNRHIEDTFNGRAYDEETINEYSTNGLEAKYGYFGSPNDLGDKLVLTRPMFVTPLPGIASMFCLPRDSKFYREEIGAHGIYNKDYDEWGLEESKLQEPLKECHVIIQGGDKPISPKTMELNGYIYKIDLDKYRDYLKPRHVDSETNREFLIDGVAEVEFISKEPHTITAHFRQEAARPKLEQAVDQYIFENYGYIEESSRKTKIRRSKRALEDEYGIKDEEATITDPDGNKTNVRVKLGGGKTGAGRYVDWEAGKAGSIIYVGSSDLRKKNHARCAFEHEKNHIIQGMMTDRFGNVKNSLSDKSKSLYLSDLEAAKTFIAKHESGLLNDHSMDPSEYIADLSAARKLGYKRYYSLLDDLRIDPIKNKSSEIDRIKNLNLKYFIKQDPETGRNAGKRIDEVMNAISDEEKIKKLIESYNNDLDMRKLFLKSMEKHDKLIAKQGSISEYCIDDHDTMIDEVYKYLDKILDVTVYSESDVWGMASDIRNYFVMEYLEHAVVEGCTTELGLLNRISETEDTVSCFYPHIECVCTDKDRLDEFIVRNGLYNPENFKMKTVYIEDVRVPEDTDFRMVDHEISTIQGHIDYEESVKEIMDMDIDDIFIEEKMDAEARKECKYWGLPDQKKYPLPDESHVRSALRFFKDCPEKDRPTLARNIVKRAEELNMDWTKWTQLKPYLSKTRQNQMENSHTKEDYEISLDDMDLDYLSEYELPTEEEDNAELDILYAEGVACIKMMNVILENGCSDSIITESYDMFFEDGDRKSIGAKVKDFFTKIWTYIKTAVSKITSIITNKFERNKRFMTTAINVFALANCVLEDNGPIEEMYIDEMSKDVKDVSDKLMKKYQDQLQNRIISKSDLRAIVNAAKCKSTPEEFDKLKQELDKIQNSDMRSFTNETNRNMLFIDKQVELLSTMNSNYQKYVQNAKLEKKSDKMGSEDVEMRVKLVEEFANSMGEVLNKMTGSKDFNENNLKNALYGTGSVFALTASTILHILKQSPKLITQRKRINEIMKDYGKDLYEANVKFDDAVFDDEQARKELGMRMNKTAQVLLFSINQIKEESYGWADDEWFNKQSYARNNPITSYVGGPFTMTFKLISAAVFGPAVLIPGLTDAVSYAGFRSVAKMMNPTGNHIDRKREVARQDNKAHKQDIKESKRVLRQNKLLEKSKLNNNKE